MDAIDYPDDTHDRDVQNFGDAAFDDPTQNAGYDADPYASTQTNSANGPAYYHHAQSTYPSISPQPYISPYQGFLHGGNFHYGASPYRQQARSEYAPATSNPYEIAYGCYQGPSYGLCHAPSYGSSFPDDSANSFALGAGFEASPTNMAPTVSPSDLNIIPQDDAGQGCGGTPNSIDQQASEVEPDGDPSLSTKSRGKTAGKSKQATKKERRPRGDPLQPKKSVTRACWADEVQDAIGNYKMRVDPATRDPIIPKGKRRAGTDRVDWRSQLSENPAGLLHRLGYFAGPSAATKRNDLGKELLQKIEQAHGRQFWPCPQTDRYGRNIIDKTEPRFLRQYLQSKLGKGDARIKKIIDDADEYVKDGERHGYLSKYDLHGVDLHWTPPLPASDDDTSSPPATSTTSTQRLASTTSAQQNPAPPIPSTRPALQPSPSRPQLQQAKPPNEDRSDPNIDPELWGVGATTQYSGPTASGAFAGQSMFQAAPVAPMMGTVWSSSLFNSLGPSNHSSTPDYTADRHTMNLSNRRKAREEDKYDDAGDYLRDSTAKRRRDTRNGPQAYTPPSAQGLAAIRASLAAGSARIFAETMNDINQSLAAASTSRRSAKKRKQSDGASDADETAGCGSGPAKKQKITTTDEALQRPHERPQAEQPSKRDSGYNSQEASPPICPANSPSTSSSLAPPPSDDVLAQTQIPANTSAAASSPSGAAMSSTAVARRV